VKKFKATYFTDSQKISGWLFIQDRRLVFRLQETSEGLTAWDEFSIAAHQQNSETVIESTLDSRHKIISNDSTLSGELKRQMDLDVQSSAEKWWRGRELLIVATSFVGLIVASLLFLILVRTSAQKLAPLVSLKREIEFGQDAFDKSYKSEVLTLSEADEAEWQKLLSQLSQLPQLQKYPWQIHIIKSKEVNAFALPGGIIVVNSGLILDSQSSDEILGVVAHEMGHVVKRHNVTQIVTDMSANFFKVFLGQGVVGAIINEADELSSRAYSRKQELEADTTGLGFLRTAGISAQGLMHVFGKKKTQAEISTEKWTKWLSTHPLDEERVANIKKLTEKTYATHALDFPLPQFKEHLAQLQQSENDK
jgi:predicted Zn-dependent protease